MSMREFLLYGFLNFGIWLVNLLWNLFQLVVMVPVYMLFKIGKMDFGDYFECARRKFSSRWRALKSDNMKLRIKFTDGKLSSDVLMYEDEVQEISDTLNAQKYSSMQDMFEKTLQVAGNYMFIVYNDVQMSNRFVQFRLNEGAYIFDFTLTRENVNGDYSGEVLELLRSMGFTKDKNDEYPNQYKFYSIMEKPDDMTTIIADCGNDRALAVKMANTVFTKMFKSSAYPRITVG